MRFFGLTAPQISRDTKLHLESIKSMLNGKSKKILHYEKITNYYSVPMSAFTTPLPQYSIKTYIKLLNQIYPLTQNMQFEDFLPLSLKALFLNHYYKEDELKKFISDEIKKAAS